MGETLEPHGNVTSSTPPGRRRFFAWPQTRMGWWAVGLAIASLTVPLLTGMINLVLGLLSPGEPRAIGIPGALMAGCSIAGGLLGLAAVVRKKEKSILVWLAILVGAAFVVLVFSDLIFGMLY